MTDEASNGAVETQPAGPQPLSDGDEVMFRQIHPTFVCDGQPSSQPFMPTPKDDNQLSVDRSEITTAAESYTLFIGDGRESVAVYGLTVGEFSEEGLRCIPEPLKQTATRSGNPAHAYADYSPHGINQQKNKAKRLKLKALARGKLHP